MLHVAAVMRRPYAVPMRVMCMRGEMVTLASLDSAGAITRTRQPLSKTFVALRLSVYSVVRSSQQFCLLLGKYGHGKSNLVQSKQHITLACLALQFFPSNCSFPSLE